MQLFVVFQDRAVVGSDLNDVDFLFQGVGVHPRHAVFYINDDHRLLVSLLEPNARVCVNGVAVKFGEPATLCNGDRCLIGQNHFFRVNCPTVGSSQEETTELSGSKAAAASSNLAIDYNRAWMEANAHSNASYAAPVRAVDNYIEQIAIKHEASERKRSDKTLLVDF